MDQIIWIIVGVLGIGLVIGYFVQTGDTRKISEILEKQALQRNGAVKPGSLISFPRLLFPYGETTVQVSVVAGSSPVTWAEFSIDRPETSFRIRNRSAGLSARKALGIMQAVPTGDEDFDDRFFVEANDQSLVLSLLDGRLRADLLALDEAYGQYKIQIRLQPNQFQISVDTFGREEEIFAGLIEIALAFYDRLADS